MKNLKKVKKILAVSLIMILALTAFTACGSKDKTEEEMTTLVLGTSADYAPCEFMYPDENGEMVFGGIDVDTAQYIADYMGVELQVENMSFSNLLTALGKGQFDIVLADIEATDERKEAVDFSEPYYEAVQYVLLPEGSEIATAEDLKNKTIGVQLGTTGDFIASDIEGTTVNTYNKGVDAVNDLINGRVDCVIIDKNPALVFESKFQDDGSKITAVDGAQFEFEPEYYAIAVPKGDTALVDAINKAIEELKADGTFDELVKTYIEE